MIDVSHNWKRKGSVSPKREATFTRIFEPANNEDRKKQDVSNKVERAIKLV